METHNPRMEVPTWIAGAILAFVVVASGYVFVYGGHIVVPVTMVFGVIGIGLSLFMLYLVYRFVVAVETIADSH